MFRKQHRSVDFYDLSPDLQKSWRQAEGRTALTAAAVGIATSFYVAPLILASKEHIVGFVFFGAIFFWGVALTMIGLRDALRAKKNVDLGT